MASKKIADLPARGVSKTKADSVKGGRKATSSISKKSAKKSSAKSFAKKSYAKASIKML